jgi:ubiquinone/menaquinone biosynthesis C-methylase UbiE
MKGYTNKYYGPEVRGTVNDFIAHDIRKGLPFTNSDIDIIFHEDFFEHLCQKDQIILLAEGLRVLKPNGVHRINTPDLIWAMKRSSFPAGMPGVHEMEWRNHGHILLVTKSYIEEIALMVGYKKIFFNSRNNSICKEEMPLEFRPGSDREENGNIFVDLIK